MLLVAVVINNVAFGTLLALLHCVYIVRATSIMAPLACEFLIWATLPREMHSTNTNAINRQKFYEFCEKKTKNVLKLQIKMNDPERREPPPLNLLANMPCTLKKSKHILA